MRHTYVAIRIAAGAHPKEIREERGHSSYKTTMDVYGHLFQSSVERTADGIEAMYEAAQKTPVSTRVAAIR